MPSKITLNSKPVTTGNFTKLISKDFDDFYRKREFPTVIRNAIKQFVKSQKSITEIEISKSNNYLVEDYKIKLESGLQLIVKLKTVIAVSLNSIRLIKYPKTFIQLNRLIDDIKKQELDEENDVLTCLYSVMTLITGNVFMECENMDNEEYSVMLESNSDLVSVELSIIK